MRALLALALGAVIGCANDAARPVSGPLAPAADAVRYRFDVRQPPSEVAERIARLEGMSSPLELAELAELYLQQGDHELAEARARKSLALLPSPNAARLTLARLANANHAFADAITLANEHLASRGANPRAAHLIIATAQLAIGDLLAARTAANEVLRFRPDSDGYLMRALIHQASGADTDAAVDFERAARAEQPGSPQEAARLRSLWARFLIRRAAYREAQLVITEALRIAPEHPLALAQRGELALRTGRARESARDFERAHALSGATRYLIDQARAVERAGDREKARILRDRAAHLIRRDPAGHQLELVEVLVDLGGPANIDEAVRIGEAELKRRASPDVRLQVARAYGKAGRREDARAQLAAVPASDTQARELASHLAAMPRDP